MTELGVDTVDRPQPVGPAEPMTVAVVGGDGLIDQVRASVNGNVRLHRPQWGLHAGTVDPDSIVAELAAERALAVCIGSDIPLDEALTVAERIDRERTEISVLLVASPTADLWRDVVRSGIRDVIDPETISSDLSPALARALDRSTHIVEQQTQVAEPSTSGRVIVVLSAKGGSGKTMVSSNLAVALTEIVDGPVALVDLDVQFGDTASALGLVPEHTITDLTTAQTLDATALKVFLTPHPGSGAYVLCGAESPEEADALTDERAAQVVEVLHRDFACVVVDTAAGVDDRMLAVLELATEVVLVASMDVSSIRNLGKEIRALDRAGLLPDERHLVLNRADDQLGLNITDVETALGMTVDVTVPSSRAVPMAMNRGRSIVAEEPTSPVSRAIVGLAHRLVDVKDADDEGDAQSWFARRRRQR